MGMRLRVGTQQVILTALKHYRLILADNGSAVYVRGSPGSCWNNDDLSNLKSVTASNFEVVAMGAVYAPFERSCGTLTHHRHIHRESQDRNAGTTGNAKLVDN